MIEEFMQMVAKEEEMRKIWIEAINNTFHRFPSQDMEIFKNWDYNSLNKLIEVVDYNGEWRVNKIFGIEVGFDNPDCQRFALRWRDNNKSWGGREFKTLLTTFDFETIHFENENAINVVWALGFKAKSTYGDRYRSKCIPRCLYYSLKDFVDTYIDFADEKFDVDKLIMVDDSEI